MMNIKIIVPETIEEKYKYLKSQVKWAITHKDITDPKDIFDLLTDVMEVMEGGE